MGKGERLWHKLAERSDLSDEPLPGLPIVEIAGDGRVLIENHFGVKGYSQEQIVVKVKYGCIQVNGKCLQLHRMTADQLVVCGKIDQISLIRRHGK